LPLGDPPLLLGFLRGVPFLWTLKLWPEWLFVNGLLLAVYYIWDRFWCYGREPASGHSRCHEVQHWSLRFHGLWPNVALLLGVILCVALLNPHKPLPGTSWRPWLYLREALQLALTLLSLLLGRAVVRKQNRFNYSAIGEVAALFVGIFVCMQPPLQILHAHGAELGLRLPGQFFWFTGGLSAVLDNAPTYLVFFETARALGGEPLVAGVQELLLTAISLGAVFLGAMTYIGNGPNFMVKAIADESGVKMPGFFGFLAYSVPVLLPLFVLTSWIFLR
jgi:Na+/H+ antiporter NhaD/arsenite permease-like protein